MVHIDEARLHTVPLVKEIARLIRISLSRMRSDPKTGKFKPEWHNITAKGSGVKCIVND